MKKEKSDKDKKVKTVAEVDREKLEKILKKRIN